MAKVFLFADYLFTFLAGSLFGLFVLGSLLPNIFERVITELRAQGKYENISAPSSGSNDIPGDAQEKKIPRDSSKNKNQSGIKIQAGEPNLSIFLAKLERYIHSITLKLLVFYFMLAVMLYIAREKYLNDSCK